VNAPLVEPRPTVAVLLAGGSAEDPLARRFGVPSKAHLPWQGGTLARGVVEALRASGAVDRIVYVGSPPADVGGLDAALPAGARLSDSLALGLGAALALEPGRLLLATADLPWLTGGDVARFAEAAPRVGLVYSVVRRAAVEERFPGQRRTYVRLAEGSFTGGNLLLLTPETVPKLLPFVERVARARKNPLLLSSLFGPAVIWGLLWGTLRVAEMERRVGALLGSETLALISDDAGIAADLDRLEDLRLGGRATDADRVDSAAPSIDLLTATRAAEPNASAAVPTTASPPEEVSR
jgi:CTP:molybdopterin cytidylyltransferase MocA